MQSNSSPEVVLENSQKAGSTRDDRHTGRTVWLWMQLNGIWFVPLLIAVILGVLWIQGAISFRENHLTDRVNMAAYGIPHLEVQVQHPVRLTAERDDASAKRVIVLPTGYVSPTIEPVEFIFRDPTGLVNFTDVEGHVTDGRVHLNTVDGRPLPSEFFIVYADVQTRSQQDLLQVRTRVKFGDQAEIEVPDLSFSIEIEHPIWRILREFVQSATGSTVTLLAMATAVFGFVRKTYTARRRIAPFIVELDRLTELHQWDKAADLCYNILEIDPFYDHIGDRFHKARERARQQETELAKWYRDAKLRIAQKEWTAAREILLPLCELRPDYRDVRDLIEHVEAEIGKKAKLEDLLQKARRADIGGDLRTAIETYKQILNIDKEYDNVAAELQRAKEWERMRSLSSSLASVRHQILPALVCALDDEHPQVRLNAVQVLGQIGDPTVRRDIQRLCQDPDTGVREAAYEALRQPVLVDVEELIAELANNVTWNQAKQKLLQIGTLAIPSLVAALGHEWPAWERAARILLEIGEEARFHLSQMLPVEDHILQQRIEEVLLALSNATQDQADASDVEVEFEGPHLQDE